MNIQKIYSELIIIPLEKEIKKLKRTKQNKELILKLQEQLKLYYEKYYKLSKNI